MSYRRNYLHDVFFDKRRTDDFDVDEDPEDPNKPMSHWQRNIQKRLLRGDLPPLSNSEPDQKKKRTPGGRCDGLAYYTPRESKFTPGILSDRLRDAMGLRDGELPLHIHKMRKMGIMEGYPPGYLRKMMLPEYNIDNLIVIPQSEWKMDEMRPTSRLEMLVYPGFNTPFEEKKPDGTSVLYDTIPSRKFQRIHHQHIANKHYWNEQNRIRREKEWYANFRKQRNATTEWDVEEDFIHRPEIERRAPTRKIRLGESKEQHVGVSVPAKPSMQPELEDFRAGILPFKPSGDNCGSGDIYKNIMKILQPSKF